jgi:hypothetical protein
VKPTLRTRKPAEELNAEDFVTFPIWKFAMNESMYDETYVKPIKQKSIPLGDLFHVSARFTIASGQSFQGIVEVLTFRVTPEYRFPLVFFGAEMLDLKPPGGPISCSPDFVVKLPALFAENYDKYLKAVSKSFGRSAADVFPIRWKALVPFEGTSTYPSGEFPYPPADGYQIQVMELPEPDKEAIAKWQEQERREREERRKKLKELKELKEK